MTKEAIRAFLRRPFLLRARAEERRLANAPHDELAVCAIFREEAPFLEEWLVFYSGIGATHFYLYNNFSTDDFRSVLAPWIQAGRVTLHEWPRRVGQLSAYRHCIRRYRRRARWIAFLDLDEFLFSPSRLDIRPILRDYAKYPGLLVYGLFFGSSGHDARPDEPVTHTYTRRAEPEAMCSGKTIANPRMVYAVRSPHVFKYWEGEAVDTRRRTLKEGRADPVFDTLRFNHYWSRSLEDLRTKVARGDASTAAARNLEWHLATEARLNDVDDTTILPIAATARAAEPLCKP